MKGKILLLTQSGFCLVGGAEKELAKHNLEIQKVSKLEDALKELKKSSCLLLILAMNGQNKFDVKGQVKALRSVTSVPMVIIAESPVDVTLKVATLNDGADQFLELPLSSEETTATSLALIRRFTDFSKLMTPTTFYYSHGILISINHHKVFIGGIEIDLLRKEFGILSALVRNHGLVLSHAQIFKEVWGEDYEENSKEVLWTQIRRLRERIQIDPKLPNFIKTVHGVGYSFDPQYDTH